MSTGTAEQEKQEAEAYLEAALKELEEKEEAEKWLEDQLKETNLSPEYTVVGQGTFNSL